MTGCDMGPVSLDSRVQSTRQSMESTRASCMAQRAMMMQNPRRCEEQAPVHELRQTAALPSAMTYPQAATLQAVAQLIFAAQELRNHGVAALPREACDEPRVRRSHQMMGRATMPMRRPPARTELLEFEGQHLAVDIVLGTASQHKINGGDGGLAAGGKRGRGRWVAGAKTTRHVAGGSECCAPSRRTRATSSS